MNLELLKERARGLLKSLTDKPEGEADGDDRPIVPDAPKNSDGIVPDERLGGEGAAEGDMDDAAEEAGAGAPPAAPEGEAGAPGLGDGDGDEMGADADGDGDGFDEHGNHDLSEEESRALAKAYGNGTGSADEQTLLHGGLDVEEVLHSILQAMEDQTVVIKTLQAEIANLKSGQSATNRKIAKALDGAPGDAAPVIPEAPKPRAVTKAIPQAPVSAPAVTPDQLFADLRAGKITQDKARELARDSRGGSL